MTSRRVQTGLHLASQVWNDSQSEQKGDGCESNTGITRVPFITKLSGASTETEKEDISHRTTARIKTGKIRAVPANAVASHGAQNRPEERELRNSLASRNDFSPSLRENHLRL